MDVPSVMHVESIEQLQNFGIQVMANDTHVVVIIMLQESHRQIQLPFGRLDFQRFLKELNMAATRSNANENGGEHSVRVEERTSVSDDAA